MSNLPFISIIVPVYNGQDTVRDCLESLLKQNYPQDRYEIIAVDNNSTDNTAAIIKSFSIQYLKETKQQGPSAARNTGTKAAKGEVFVFFDADQVAEKDYLVKLLQGWPEPQYGAFSGLNKTVSGKDNLVTQYWAEEWRLNVNAKHHPALPQFSGGLVAIPNAIFQKIGGFDENMRTCEDTDLAWRLQKELGLKIKYNHDAISYHQERVDIRSLLRREFAFGAGSYILSKKHKEATRPLSRSLFSALKRTVLGVLAMILGLFKFCIGKYRVRNFQLTIMGIAMTWANFFGKAYSAIKIPKATT